VLSSRRANLSRRRPNRSGSIVNLSAIVGSHPVAKALLYASAKGAIETLTRGLALELAPRKIRVNAIAPGHTETEGNEETPMQLQDDYLPVAQKGKVA
jgi:NAD(P)-dependent dehydrogenase (short-subunit alcohol dehydrogenase family)